jgi:hypothetical protein
MPTRQSSRCLICITDVPKSVDPLDPTCGIVGTLGPAATVKIALPVPFLHASVLSGSLSHDAS